MFTACVLFARGFLSVNRMLFSTDASHLPFVTPVEVYSAYLCWSNVMFSFFTFYVSYVLVLIRRCLFLFFRPLGRAGVLSMVPIQVSCFLPLFSAFLVFLKVFS